MLLCSSDEEYLVALDGTKWLSRISELLETCCKVCRAMTEEEAHVLVCYEGGWDRTTQVYIPYWCTVISLWDTIVVL